MKYLPGLPISKPKLLLGEGVDEVYFLTALLDQLGIDDVQVDQYGGKRNLRAGLEAVLKRSGFQNVVSLGITRDADFPDDPGADVMTAAPSAFQSVCSALTAVGLPVPAAAGVMASGQIRTRVFLFPDGTNPGMLEDLCLASAHGDPAFGCVQEFFDCVSQRSGRAPARNLEAKAHVHAWLATCSEPDKRLGEGAQAGYWDWSNPVLNDLKDFIRSL